MCSHYFALAGSAVNPGHI